MTRNLGPIALPVIALAVLGLPAAAQHEPVEPPPPPPPPAAVEDLDEQEKREQGKETEPERHEQEPETPFIPENDGEWGLDDEFLEMLAQKATAYRDYALSFTCTEIVRTADYDRGEATQENVRQYAYLLERDDNAENLVEFRQRVKDNGRISKSPTNDEEIFPPAYGWVFLFSKFNQPYFDYRDLGNRFDGFDWVKEIQFKGQLPFSDGKDIRQWEGVVVVDAVSFIPIEIRTEPSNQKERIDQMYKQWANSFGIMGMKVAARPFGYRGRIQFRERRPAKRSSGVELSFPTELRYDTFRMVTSKQVIPVEASIRQYKDYRFYSTRTSETIRKN